MNAAVWFGGSLFFALAVAPTFFTPEMQRLFGKAYVGIIAQTVLERYFLLQYWCSAIAILHQLAEWVYLGRVLPRLTLYILAGVMAFGLVGGLWFQPKLKRLNAIKYSAEYYRREIYSPAAQAQAKKSFAFWHWVSLSVNGLALAGLGYYTWRVMNPPETTRYIAPVKFRG
jgi:hypothetical protein